MTRTDWRHHRPNADQAVTSDARIPPDQVEAIRVITEQITAAVDRVIAASPLGAPEARIVMLRYAHGASALVAEPATDPVLILAAMWNALAAAVDSLGSTMEEFTELMLANDQEAEDADEDEQMTHAAIQGGMRAVERYLPLIAASLRDIADAMRAENAAAGGLDDERVPRGN